MARAFVFEPASWRVDLRVFTIYLIGGNGRYVDGIITIEEVVNTREEKLRVGS